MSNTDNSKKVYDKVAVPALMKEFSFANEMAVPRITKVTINSSFGRTREDKAFVATVLKTLEKITGQKPIATKAKKSISNFKVREGNVIGASVTLRGSRMYDFIDRLVHVAYPRVRDFHGLEIKKGFDGNGNYAYGFREHIAFPEISSDEVERLHGLEVAITTTSESDNQTLSLLRLLGFPFQKDKSKN